jgi:hypothetical protein
MTEAVEMRLFNESDRLQRYSTYVCIYTRIKKTCMYVCVCLFGTTCFETNM